MLCSRGRVPEQKNRAHGAPKFSLVCTLRTYCVEDTDGILSGKAPSPSFPSSSSSSIVSMPPTLWSSILLSASVGGPACRAWMMTIPPHNHPRRSIRPSHGASTTAGHPRRRGVARLYDRPRDVVEGVTPPMPFRDESSYVVAGPMDQTSASSSSSSMMVDDGSISSSTTKKTTSTTTTNMPLRQSPSSSNPLLSSPRYVPDPYGWMRDDTRSNVTVLNHLRTENEYTEIMTSHLVDLREDLYREVR